MNSLIISSELIVRVSGEKHRPLSPD